jgi:hypothetical protein
VIWCSNINRTTHSVADYLAVKQPMFPLEFCLVSKQAKPSSFEPIWNDAACLHFTIFVTKVYLDFTHGEKKINQTAQAHFVKALAILQHRLASSSDKVSTSDSTILVVIGLTMVASFLDLETALKHLRGLHKMIMLRGGISAFNGNRKLQIKICRQVGPFVILSELYVLI